MSVIVIEKVEEQILRGGLDQISCMASAFSEVRKLTEVLNSEGISGKIECDLLGFCLRLIQG